jgi:transcriptional regulatory protein LevR/transcriptional regulator with AAA-type ATPase domain
MSRIDEVLEFLKREVSNNHNCKSLSAEYIARTLGYSRCNVSNDLNRLCEQDKVIKMKGRPVLYSIKRIEMNEHHRTKTENFNGQNKDVFTRIIGMEGSLRVEIEKAKAAVLYPPFGLTTMILGPTGVGKTMLARFMYEYAIEMSVLKDKASFVTFNCADYANNPQLITAQLFGYAKGAFTGADKEKEGLVEKANQGILFLDEVHRLPPEAQEMLFCLMDQGVYRRLGEVNSTRKSNPLIILATTEDPGSVMLKTFLRRVPVIINLPALAERGFVERLNILEDMLRDEAVHLNHSLYINSNVVKAMLSYDCPGNIGQLKSDLKLICAKAYMNYIMGKRNTVAITMDELSMHIKEGLLKIKNRFSGINLISCDLEVKPDSQKSLLQQMLESSSVYDVIERNYCKYIEMGLDVESIESHLSNDIDVFYDELLSSYKLNKKFRNEELLKIVSDETIFILEKAIELIEKDIGKKVGLDYCGAFALHINSAIKRVKAGKTTVNPNIHKVREEHSIEFIAATKILKIMNDVCGYIFPEIEVSFIKKLIEIALSKDNRFDRVSILVVAHGSSSAKSMAEVANRLIGKQLVSWYDMDLDEQPECSLNTVMNIISQIDVKKGVLLLVDMGSLLSFGEIITCKTGISVKTIYKVSTPMVIEAAHLVSDPDASLDYVYSRMMEINSYTENTYRSNSQKGSLPKVLLTVCVTGQGTAVKLKELVEKRFDFHSLIDVLPLDFSSIDEFEKKVNEIHKVNEIAAIVGISGSRKTDVPFISVDELIFGQGIKMLENILKKYCVCRKEDNFRKEEVRLLSEALTSYLNYLDAEKLTPYVLETLRQIESAFSINFNKSSFVTLFIHLCCMVERLIFDKSSCRKSLSNKKTLVTTTISSKLRQTFHELEDSYKIRVTDGEYEFLYEYIKKIKGNCK